MADSNSVVLAVIFAAVFFYVLYGVIRAAVRDGILRTDERRQKAGVRVNGSGDGV